MDEPVKRLEKIHDEFRACKDENFRLKFDEVKILMMKYDSDEYDLNQLKTVLIITNGFKDHDLIKDIRKSILLRHGEKLNKIYEG